MWKSSIQSVTAFSTCSAEIVAQSDSITISEDVHQIHSVLNTGKDNLNDNSDGKGLLFCDNRSAVINAKKLDITDVPRKSRHVALRNQKVLEHGVRSFFTPTAVQLADGLTKSPTGQMLVNMLHPHMVKCKTLEQKQEDHIPVSCLAYAVHVKEFVDVNFGYCWWGEP